MKVVILCGGTLKCRGLCLLTHQEKLRHRGLNAKDAGIGKIATKMGLSAKIAVIHYPIRI